VIRPRVARMFIVLLTLTLASVPGTANSGEWNFYGSARFATFYVQQSGDVPTNPNNVADTDLEWNLRGNSRIGAIVESGAVGGRFEYGASGGNANLRLLYGTWDFGWGSLLVGQNFTPITSNFSNQVIFTDQTLYNIGDPFAGRQPQLKLIMGEFQLALIQPNIPENTVLETSLTGTTGDVVNTTTVPEDFGLATTGAERLALDSDVVLPKIEIAYKHQWNKLHVRLKAGYQTYDLVDASNQSVAVDSFLVGLAGKGGFNAGHIGAGVYYGKNLGTYGALNSGLVSNLHFDNDLPRFEGDSLKDSTTLVAALLFHWNFTERLKFETGAGHRWMHTDTNVAREQQSWVVYAQMPVMLASTVKVVPEIGYYDFGALEQGPSKQQLGNIIYAGAKWQIDFYLGYFGQHPSNIDKP